MRGILSVLSLLALIAVGAASPSAAATIPVTVDFDASSVRLTETPGGVICVGASGQSTGWFEMPSLPYTVVSVLLPQGEEVASFRLEGGVVRELVPSVSLASFTGLELDDGTVQGLSAPRSELVDKDQVFPRWKVRHTGTSSWHGYRIATFEVYPVRYELSSGRLTVDEGTTLVVETAPANGGEEAVRERHVDGFRERARRAVSGIVANPGEAAAYRFDEIVVDPGDRGFMPSYLPGLEGSAVSYVIITNEEMSAEFQRLADWKTKKGIPAVVRTIEWIEQNYRSGADVGETVRNFIRAAYEKWGVDYVLLGGDTDVIPARFAYTTFYTGDFIPTDMYYSCLDGNWNADGDSLWGEAYHSIADPGDDADLYAEVFCGRLPASTVSEARILVDKTIDYENAVDRTYQDRFLLLGEVIFPSDYSPGSTIILDGAEILESIYNNHLVGLPDATATRLYENYPGYPGSSELTMASSRDAMNAGTNHVMHAGHGYKYNMSVGNGSLLNYDAYSLTNGDQIFSMFLMNCTNVAFDTDCLAEYFMLNPNGGAFAVTGSSRSAFPSASRPYMDEYYSLLYDDAVVQLGKAQTLSREPFTPAAFGETADRWTHFIYNYLGDPEANMYRGAVDTFVVAAPPSLAFGENSVTVTVSSGGSPYDSAFVCLYKSGDDYVYGATGPTGEVNFPDFLIRSGGIVTLTVTGLGHAPYTTTIPVTLESGPYLRVSSKYIDDDIAGNNDDVLDAGESVHLYVRLLNSGSTTAQKLWAEVTALDPSVSMIDDTSLYPNIIPGALAYGTTPFSFSVDPSVADETPVEFRVDVHDSTGGSWSEMFAFEIHAPELELFINTVSDAAPYGNGNGIIENGEPYLLTVGVKNFGSGEAYGLQGKLRSEDGGAIVTDSVATYAPIPLLGISYGDGFVLSETNVSIDNHLEFELVDQYGRMFAERLELRAPGAPHALSLDASLGPDEIHVTWHPPDSTETYSYLVYHSKTSGGPYTLASIDRVGYTLYRDRDLDASTRYYYVIAAVDSCGNVGPLSDEATITTSPPQLAGWPNTLGKETASSPKVADVDGDTHPDIVVGAEYVYAWDGNGIELRDGDNQPLTWGIFNTEGDNFTATVALADLDGILGAEIVGASWNTKEIYVFRNDGSIMPGWPKSTVDLCWASPVVGDFDGDGGRDLEIIAYDVDGTVYVWHADGTELIDGDSNPSTDGVFFRAGLSSQGWHISTPALADMDDDGIVEMIVCAPQDSIYCLNSDLSRVAGWPVFVGDAGASIGASPVVGDVDGDGFPEVMIQNSYGRVQGLNHDGTSMSGWPKWVYSNNAFAGSIGLADFTGDGKLEVVVPGMNGLCYFYRYNGQAMPGWPQAYADSGPTECSVVIADIDGDHSLDIILGSEEGRLNAWNINGEYIPGFPIQLNGFVRGTPVVKDMDLDGDLELIADCWDQNVFVWDLEAEHYYGCVQWNGFHGNQFNSGWKELETVTDASVTAWMFELGAGYVQLSWSIAGDERAWDLLRRTGDGEFELIAADLAVDGSRTLNYTDRTVEEGLVYVYRLVPSGGGDGVDTEAIEIPVASARLYQNHPNPFNPSTTITFTVPGGADARRTVVLGVYDVRGALVRTLVDGPVSGGRHEIAWNGTNDRGVQVASGVYFAKFMTAGTTEVKKMVLLR